MGSGEDLERSDATLETLRLLQGKEEGIQVSTNSTVSRGSGCSLARSRALRSDSRFLVGEAPCSKAEALRQISGTNQQLRPLPLSLPTPDCTLRRLWGAQVPQQLAADHSFSGELKI